MSQTQIPYTIIQGQLKTIYPIKSFKNSFEQEHEVQEFDFEEVKRYPKLIIFSCYNEKIKLLKGIEPGDIIRVQFQIESNRHNSRSYTNLKVYGIEKIG